MPDFPDPAAMRNIPAHAGKTRRVASVTMLVSEHPRARGENRKRKSPSALSAGTSPRTRGKRKGHPVSIAQSRNIPAHAGKTPSCRSGPSRPSEHPRARGENASITAGAMTRLGTSPRTRGKLRPTTESAVAVRNIPAHAGKHRAGVKTRAVGGNIPAHAGKT